MKFLTSLLLLPGLAIAAPMSIDHTARLLDGLGAPVQGSVSVSVQLFDAATGGVSLWSNTYTPTAADGYVSLTLTGGTPALSTAVFDHPEVWLELQVGVDPALSPRTRLSSVPYALQADQAARVALNTGTLTEPCTDGALGLDAATSTLSVCSGAVWVAVSGASATGTAAAPALSCQSILNDTPSSVDGAYWIDPDGVGGQSAFEAWCDMDPTGGWTLAYVMCQDSTGSILSMDRTTPITPGDSANPSALSYTTVTQMNPSQVRFTSDFTGGIGYLFNWSTVTAGNNFAQVLFDGTTSALNTCNTWGVPLAGSTGATCSMSVEHNNGGAEPFDIPTLGCGCHVWSTGGMMWGQIDALSGWGGVSHRVSHTGFSGAETPTTTTGCIEAYVR